MYAGRQVGGLCCTKSLQNKSRVTDLCAAFQINSPNPHYVREIYIHTTSFLSGVFLNPLEVLLTCVGNAVPEKEIP